PFRFLSHATAPTEIYTLSLHDALPISKGTIPSSASTASRKASPLISKLRYWSKLAQAGESRTTASVASSCAASCAACSSAASSRSEEHTSELQSRENLVCRLLLEKKKK